VAAVADLLEIAGPLAVVTAGWEEREDQDAELRDHLRGRTENLRLYGRAEELFEADAGLARAWRERQERLRELQEAYRLRLAHALDAARELLAWPEPSPAIASEQTAAIEAVRELDRHHLEAIAAVHGEFERAVRPAERPSLVQQRDEVAAIVGRSAALAIAGGHVIVLLNRLRLFAAPAWLAGRPVLAWSAGAMALSRRVVVFHDSPPQGAGNAEVLEAGLGLFSEVLAFPHARRRLRLDDSRRVALLARRMAPSRCVLLDDGDRLFWNGSYWSAPEGIRWLEPDGAVGTAQGGLPLEKEGR
jgi:hypothetical protein